VRLGFVSVRFAGLDGVSLEAAKVAEAAMSAGHEVAWFAGELAPSFGPGMEEPVARFDSPENLALQARCFGAPEAPADTLDLIDRRATELEGALLEFIEDFGVQVLVPQNALSIPMQLPLGAALARMAEAGVPVVAHHHDFWWERERFSPTGVGHILRTAFPPVGPATTHVVINSLQQRELARRVGAESHVLPNVMDFESEPKKGDGAAFRRYAGAASGDVLMLQATRIIPRKSIELTLELAARLDGAKVVVTHPDLDEGADYARSLERRAAQLGADYRVAPVGEPGLPSLADAYAAADLVAFPSRVEGFGNGLLEAIYHGRPALVNRYPVFVADIAPAGFKLIEIEGAISSETVTEAERWLSDESLRASAAARNYELGLERFSYAAIRRVFLPLLES